MSSLFQCPYCHDTFYNQETLNGHIQITTVCRKKEKINQEKREQERRDRELYDKLRAEEELKEARLLANQRAPDLSPRAPHRDFGLASSPFRPKYKSKSKKRKSKSKKRKSKI